MKGQILVSPVTLDFLEDFPNWLAKSVVGIVFDGEIISPPSCTCGSPMYIDTSYPNIAQCPQCGRNTPLTYFNYIEFTDCGVNVDNAEVVDADDVFIGNC